jgi:hypothetical protein
VIGEIARRFGGALAGLRQAERVDRIFGNTRTISPVSLFCAVKSDSEVNSRSFDDVVSWLGGGGGVACPPWQAVNIAAIPATARSFVLDK